MTLWTTGMTLCELMITLAIIAIVLSIAVITMSGYIPKQRLISAQSQFADLIQRAQTEANARGYWTCIKFTSGTPLTAQIYLDSDANHGTNNACGTGTDLALTNMVFKDNISLAAATTGCSQNIKTGCRIWFDTTGSPKLCPGDTLSDCGAAAGSTGATNCIDWSYQIVFSNPKLSSTARAREVEVLQGGMVQVVKPTESGLVTSNPMAAASPINPGGCE